MPHSHYETKPWVVEKIIQLDPPVKVLDVGAGAGMWHDYLRSGGYEGHLDAIEVWRPYIDKYNLKRKYHVVYNHDVRDWQDFYYDVVILGDVLEHMTKDEAVALVQRISTMAKHIVIAIPVVHYPQGALEGNPYEVHVKDDWTNQEVLDSFENITDYRIFSTTAAYWLTML